MPEYRNLHIQPLDAERFRRFGDVLDTRTDRADFRINAGHCERFHDRARLDMGGGRAGISLFRAEAYVLPLTLELMERHPLGSQAFLPLDVDNWLVVVAEDVDGQPGRPEAYLFGSQTGVNYHRNVWHAVLTPLDRAASFAVVDRIGEGCNLEEHHFDPPWRILP